MLSDAILGEISFLVDEEFFATEEENVSWHANDTLVMYAFDGAITSTPSKAKPKKKKGEEYPCLKCPHRKPFKTEKGLKNHKIMHTVSIKSSNYPDAAAVNKVCHETSSEVLKEFLNEDCCSFSVYGKSIEDCCRTVLQSEDLNSWEQFINICSSCISIPLCSSKKILPSMFRSELFKGINQFLSLNGGRDLILSKLKIVFPQTGDDVLNIFLVEFLMKLGNKCIAFMIQSIRGHKGVEVLKIHGFETDLEMKQNIHYVAGSVMNSFLSKSVFYPNSKKFALITDIINSGFLEGGPNVTPVSAEIREWTARRSRGGLKSVGQEALDFFIHIMNHLLKLDVSKVKKIHEKMLINISQDGQVILIWDSIIDGKLPADITTYFMEGACKLFCNTVFKGHCSTLKSLLIKQAAPTSVPLRSALAQMPN